MESSQKVVVAGLEGLSVYILKSSRNKVEVLI